MRAVAILLAVGIGACATPYQQRGFAGGYTDQRIGRDRFLITVNVNSYTSSSVAYEYFVRRAWEVCTASGFTDWSIEDRGGGTDVMVLQGNAYAKPHVEGLVRCTDPARSAD
jgi:hypothetical protein